MSNRPWENDKWYTSPWNFDNQVKEFYNFPEKIKFYDVTLRDGEQQSGLVFNKDQKVAIAEKLAEVGIHRIEAGMPVVSKQDEEAIREIVKRNLGPEIFTFARCMVSDAQHAVDLGVNGIVMEIPANELLIKHGYKWETQRAIDAAIKSTKFAHDNGLYVTLFMIDFARADFDYLTNFVDQVNKYGHFDALACVDTFGVLNPLGAYFMVKRIKARYPDKVIEIHAHDDFGLGSANTIMALAAGAEVAHTTISATGERAGNVSYEDVDLSLLTMYGIDTGLKHELLYPTSRFFLDLAGIECRPNRGIIGPDISKMESGLPIAWYENLKDINPLILLPYKFSLTGHPDVTYTIGKHSGAATIQFYLKQLGMPFDNKEMVLEIVDAVKEKAFELGHELSINLFQEIASAICDKYSEAAATN
jgi:isopropylmalate/homocitrate/citramalate synthase